MRRWWKKSRKIVVDETVYRYSLLDCPEYRTLRIYREYEKQPMICLRQSWTEAWGIDLFRPKMVAYIIGWHEGSGRGPQNIPSLQEESTLFQGLMDICFSPEEAEQRAWFLERIRS